MLQQEFGWNAVAGAQVAAGHAASLIRPMTSAFAVRFGTALPGDLGGVAGEVVDLATCNTARLSETVSGTIERDAGAQLRAEVAGAAIQIGRDANDQVNSCQAVINAYGVH